jgi:hypothetical protein
MSADLEVPGNQQMKDDPVLPQGLEVRWSTWSVTPAYDNSVGR